MTQDIINALGRFSALTVMSWNAVAPYKGKPASPEDIGHGLAVSYLVKGQSGDRVRVIAQLVDTRQGRVLWSARFEEALADVSAVQDIIVTDIVRAPGQMGGHKPRTLSCTHRNWLLSRCREHDFTRTGLSPSGASAA
ncbi:UNVERIFIED_ORG: TolB-like protein [Rhizobium etli]